MVSLITWLVMLVLGAGIGVLMAINNLPLNFFPVAPIALALAFILLFARNTYISTRSTNMNEVEKLLHKYRKRPYVGFLHDVLNGIYEEAEKHLPRIRNNQQRAAAMTVLYLHKKDIDMAKQENRKIKNGDIRHYNSAFIGLLEGDLNEFHRMKDKIRSKSLQYILSAEEAYKEGHLEEAERFGNMAISTAAGIQKLTLVKSLEREQNNPHRDTYFSTFRDFP